MRNLENLAQGILDDLRITGSLEAAMELQRPAPGQPCGS